MRRFPSVFETLEFRLVSAIISISPQVRSAIIVGNSVHLITEGSFSGSSSSFVSRGFSSFAEKEIFPIGQRSFTSPASVLQPFRSQLRGQVTVNNYGREKTRVVSFFDSSSFFLSAMPSDLTTCAPLSSSSFHQPSSNTNLFVAYDVLTFDSATSTANGDDNVSGSILTSRGSIILVDDHSSTYLFDTPV